MKAFLFLYPIPPILDFEINLGVRFIDLKKERQFQRDLNAAKTLREKTQIMLLAREQVFRDYKRFYGDSLNRCIDERYRRKGFRIFYAIFKNCQVSNLVHVLNGDSIILTDVDYSSPEEFFKYPRPRHLLNQLGDVSVLRIGGFHLWDCVQRVARSAYRRGIDTLVDEDLTELFTSTIRRPEFKFDTYPTYNPRSFGEDAYKIFFEVRRSKPWMRQK